MIRLTRRSGEIEIVNPDRIERIVEAHADSGARIIFPDGESYSYREPTEEVARKVLEWRLEMEAYKQSVLGNNFNISADCASRLRLLAGLE